MALAKDSIYRQAYFITELLEQPHLQDLSLLVAFSLRLSKCGTDCQPGRVGDLWARPREARGADLFSFLPLHVVSLSTPLYSLPFVLLQLLVGLGYHHLLRLVELPLLVNSLAATDF